MAGRRGKEVNKGVSHGIKPPAKKKKPQPKAQKTPSTRSSNQQREPTDEELDAAVEQNPSNKTPKSASAAAPKTPKVTQHGAKTPKTGRSGGMLSKTKVFSMAESPVKAVRNSPRKNPETATPEKPKKKFFGSRTSPRKVTMSLTNNIVVQGNTKSAKRFTSAASKRSRSPINLRVLKPTKISPISAAVEVSPDVLAHESPVASKENTPSPKKTPVEANTGEKKRKLAFRDLEDDVHESPSKKKKTDAEVADDPPSSVTDGKTKVYPIFNKQNWKKDDPEPQFTSKSPVRITEKARARMKATKGKKLEQLQIDAGQKDLAPATCQACCMMYIPGDEDDQIEHEEFHFSVSKLIKCIGWKKEIVVWATEGARVMMISPDQPAYAWNKLVQVTEMIDKDLGIVSNGLKKKAGLKGYLYIKQSLVEGALIAEPITEGNRAIFPEDEMQPFCCAEEGTPAKCGVNRVWTAAHSRREGIASRLVDCVRETFLPNQVLDKKDVAFSDPTPSGMHFAAKYCETKEFLVYRPIP